jgi:hypothetical protein
MAQEEDWLLEAQRKLDNMPEGAKRIREQALEDLYFFARLVNPGYMYGSVHRELFRWLQDYSLFGQGNELCSNKLMLLPRGHLKSHVVATWLAWIITRHPEVTALYLSATAELAETQLYAVKNIMGSSTYRRYFPEYIHPQEGKREKWSATKLSIDHPRRKSEGIRDATIATAGLTTNTTGWHADIIVADDLVVPENAYTEEGRNLVSRKASQFTSIRNSGGFTVACGTRYHPADVYKEWKEQVYDVYDDEGIKIDVAPVWDIKEYAVEEDGIFLWPRAVRKDGKAFGFNQQILARIKAEYSDRVQFYAQYYNDPNDPGSDRISRDKFQYYNPRFLKKSGDRWYMKDNKLNVYASVDFAYSLKKTSDYTAIVVIGIDHTSNIYILDIDRFKTDKIADYFEHIRNLHEKWNFNKLRCEVSVAQKVIVNGIKDYITKNGLRLSVEEFRPTRHEGTKEERIAAALEYRYDNLEMWHFEGGWTDVLEEELVLSRPPHDDIKDALASAVSIAVAPTRSMRGDIKELFSSGGMWNKRFGGVSY